MKSGYYSQNKLNGLCLELTGGITPYIPDDEIEIQVPKEETYYFLILNHTRI